MVLGTISDHSNPLLQIQIQCFPQRNRLEVSTRTIHWVLSRIELSTGTAAQWSPSNICTCNQRGKRRCRFPHSSKDKMSTLLEWGVPWHTSRWHACSWRWTSYWKQGQVRCHCRLIRQNMFAEVGCRCSRSPWCRSLCCKHQYRCSLSSPLNKFCWKLSIRESNLIWTHYRLSSSKTMFLQ